MFPRRFLYFTALFAALAVLPLGTAATATAQPEPTLTISPPSGPCDATVEVSGRGFEPGATVPLDLARPYADTTMGRLGVATVGSDGQFSIQVSLGALGCEAAALASRVPYATEPRQLHILAGHEPARRFLLARAGYAYTISPAPAAMPAAPPATGSGPASSRNQVVLVVALAALACGSVLLVLGALGSGRHFFSDRRRR